MTYFVPNIFSHFKFPKWKNFKNQFTIKNLKLLTEWLIYIPEGSSSFG